MSYFQLLPYPRNQYFIHFFFKLSSIAFFLEFTRPSRWKSHSFFFSLRCLSWKYNGLVLNFSLLHRVWIVNRLPFDAADYMVTEMKKCIIHTCFFRYSDMKIYCSVKIQFFDSSSNNSNALLWWSILRYREKIS